MNEIDVLYVAEAFSFKVIYLKISEWCGRLCESEEPASSKRL